MNEERGVGVSHGSRETGWVAMAPQGDRVRAVRLVRHGNAPPRVSWACHAPWNEPLKALRMLRRSRSLGGQRTVAVLQHAQYQLLTLDAPDVPREEWRDAVRWRLKDMVDFPVESAGIDVLDIPAEPEQRRRPSLFAIAAPRTALGPLADAGHDAGLPWSAIDVPETALRNIVALVASGDRAEALLHVSPLYSTLVVAARGELLVARHIEVGSEHLTHIDPVVRQQHVERAGLELQRTLDNVERQFAHADLARLQIAPGAPLCDFIAFVGELVYVPVVAFDLGAALDCSDVPELADPLELAAYLPAIGAALR